MSDNNLNPPVSPSLTDADGKACDAFLAGHLGESPVPQADVDPARVERVGRLFHALESYPVKTPPLDLVNRTLARVKRQERQTAKLTEHIESLAAPPMPGMGVSWVQWAAVAAVVGIMIVLALPSMQHNRMAARKIADQNNLAAAGMSMNQYAGDFDNTLPRGHTQPGQRWDQVGQPVTADGRTVSNSANLYLLVNQGYIHPATLASPTNPYAPRSMPADARDWSHAREVSYSYQNQYGPAIRINRHPTIAVLANKNPLFEFPKGQPLRFRTDLPTTASSQLMHGGQNVLTSDGTVTWRTSPTLENGDNIWLIHGLNDHYQGNEAPSDPNDAFLVP